jgi:hypothetical protein
MTKFEGPDGRSDCYPDGVPETCQLVSWKAARASFPSSTSPARFSVVVQQRFDDFETLFYGGELPQVFTALAED